MSVSIIICCYNSEIYVEELIESLNQIKDLVFEVIFIDDFSNDNTVATLNKSLNHVYFEYKLIVNEQNLGTVKSLDKAINQSKYEIVKPLGCDDFIIANTLKEIVDIMIKSDEIEFVFGNIIHFQDSINGRNYKTTYNDVGKLNFFSKANLIEWTLLKWEFNTPSWVFKKSFLDKIGGLDNEICLIEDVPIILKSLENNILFHFSEVAYVYYRVHDNSISRSTNQSIREKMFRDKKIIFQKYISKYQISILIKIFKFLDIHGLIKPYRLKLYINKNLKSFTKGKLSKKYTTNTCKILDLNK